MQQQLRAVCEQKDRAEGQLQALRLQQEQQAPQVAALVSERQDWIAQLQKERAAASQATQKSEVALIDTLSGLTWFLVCLLSPSACIKLHLCLTCTCCRGRGVQLLNRLQQHTKRPPCHSAILMPLQLH